jgi:GTP-binding protein
MVDVDKQTSLLFADIPGLIEGASEGKGLGDEFLRHVERTAVLIHLVDIYNDSVVEAYQTIQNELKSYKVDLSNRPQIVALTKIEGFDQEMLDDRMAELKAVVPKTTMVTAISSASKQGVPEMLRATAKLVQKAREKQAAKEPEATGVPILTMKKDDSWTVKKLNDGYKVTGRKIEKFAARTDFDDEHGVQRIRDIMKKMGIMNKLIKDGIESGDTIVIGRYGSIEY